MKRKKTVALLLAAGLLLSATACGGKADETADPAAEQESVTETEDSDAQSDAQEVTQSAADVGDLTYGNDPNNFYQSSHAPCFGDGRVYYIDLDDNLASFALDGSDPQTHGSVHITDSMSSPGFLNWYNGAVYYMVNQYREDYTAYLEIVCMDPQTGTETVVETIEGDSDSEYNPYMEGMQIIGDRLFYAFAQSDTVTVRVKDLVSGEENELFHNGTKGGGVSSAVFATDGENLYAEIPNTLDKVYSLPLSELYSADSLGDPLASLGGVAAVFSEDGIYTTMGSEDTSYVFYAYQDSGSDWPYETIVEDVISNGKFDTEQDIIDNLIWLTVKWVLGDALASIQGKTLYYSPSVDYMQSSSVTELDFESSYANGRGLFAGEYQDVLYLICQNEDTTTLHTLTADGTFQ